MMNLQLSQVVLPETVLCSKGFAQPGYAEERTEVTVAMRDDFSVIRTVFNRWYGPINTLDEPAQRQREMAERQMLLGTIYRLYAIGFQHAPAHLRRPLSAHDVERVFATVRRITLAWKVDLERLTAYCAARATRSAHTLEHVIDPLQLRHILSFHTEASFHPGDLDLLRNACRNGDVPAIRAWMEAAGDLKGKLSRQAPQALRYVVLELWPEENVDFATLAFELAALNVRLFQELGWENTRTFFALLSRIAGCDRPDFAAYLNDEDLDEALLLHQNLKQEKQCAFFRSKLVAYDSAKLRALQRSVFDRAAKSDAPVAVAAPTPQRVVVAPPAPKTGLLQRFKVAATAA